MNLDRIHRSWARGRMQKNGRATIRVVARKRRRPRHYDLELACGHRIENFRSNKNLDLPPWGVTCREGCESAKESA